MTQDLIDQFCENIPVEEIMEEFFSSTRNERQQAMTDALELSCCSQPQDFTLVFNSAKEIEDFLETNLYFNKKVSCTSGYTVFDTRHYSLSRTLSADLKKREGSSQSDWLKCFDAILATVLWDYNNGEKVTHTITVSLKADFFMFNYVGTIEDLMIKTAKYLHAEKKQAHLAKIFPQFGI